MWQRIMGADMDMALHQYGRGGTSRRVLLAGVGAALAALALIPALPSIELLLTAPARFTVAEGMVRNVRLTDGTQITLAKGADMEVRYTRRDRVIELKQGAIYANVAHDQARPFCIDAGNARIVDIGTAFEVVSRPGNVRVAVSAGEVRFGRQSWFGAPITLTVNQAAVLDEAGLKRIPDIRSSDIALWRNDWVEYDNTPLRRVIADLQPLSPLRLVIADRELAERSVGGRIRLTDPAGQLENLSIVHGFRIRRTGDTLVISKK